MPSLFGILYAVVLLVISVHASQYTEAALGHDLNSSLPPNMTATLPVERVSLGKVPPELTHGLHDESSSIILAPMDTFTTDCNIHSTGCWGFFVVRIAYGDGIDDERISAAMRRLEDAADNIISCWRRDEPRGRNCEEIDSEARSRYHSVLLQEPFLAGATIPQARRYFQEWAKPWCEEGPDNSKKLTRTARFMAFILLDEQVLANIETFPERGDLDAFDEIYLHATTQWVKLIDTDNEDPEAGKVAVTAYTLAHAFRVLAEEAQGLEAFPRNTEFSETRPGWELFEE